jgi:heme-degrading monooxygenase HmoA
MLNVFLHKARQPGASLKRPSKSTFLASALLIGATLTVNPASAQTPSSELPVTVLVVVKTPPGVTRGQIEEGFRKAVPLYEKVPGLVRKSFTVNDEGFGGMYLWKNRASAQNWFNDSWRAKVKASYGSDPEVRYFDAPLTIDGAGARGGE